MVLWEITAATAYFLGLKRTYRIALRLQRKVVGPRHDKIRRFLHRRTRAIFEVAISVHKNIQRRDLEAGRSIGSRILRFLDRIKPSAQIRGSSGKQPNISSSSSTEITSKPPNLNSTGKRPNTSSINSSGISTKSPNSNKSLDGNDDSRRHFTSFSRNFVPLPSIMTMKPTEQVGIYSRPHRHDVLRRDIVMWMYAK